MIGWRIGWAAGPAEVMRDVASAVVYSTVVPSGFTQAGARAALTGDDDIDSVVGTWQQRRDLILRELAGLPVVSPDGGWSMLVDAVSLGTDARTLSARLLGAGRVAATPMTAWGPGSRPTSSAWSTRASRWHASPGCASGSTPRWPRADRAAPALCATTAVRQEQPRPCDTCSMSAVKPAAALSATSQIASA
jgi:hypothetical protein